MSRQIGKKAYNERSDIWALGCILYEMACLHTPFEAQNEPALAAKIKAGRIHKLPSCYSDALARAIYSMLQVDMSKRPKITELLALPQVAMRLNKLAAPADRKVEPTKPAAAPASARHTVEATNPKPAVPAWPAPSTRQAAPAPSTYQAAPAPSTRPSTAVAAPSTRPSAAVGHRPTTAREEVKQRETPRETPRGEEAALARQKDELARKEADLLRQEKELEKRERKVALEESVLERREKEVERKQKMAQEQMDKASKMMSEYKSSVATSRPKTTPAVPLFDENKENGVTGKANETDKEGKPLQPLHNIYDRREKLLARLLNHRVAT
jgi:hypothetical protein